MRRARTRLPLRLALIALAGLPWAACAQTAFSVGALSDLRVRGLSFSERRPVLQAAVNHDFANGAYAGALASRARFGATRMDAFGSMYAGYARDFGRASVDAGVVRNVIANGAQYRYDEVYAGLAWERLSARLSHAVEHNYLELNANTPLAEHLEASLHLGYLKPLNRQDAYASYRQQARADVRAGLHAFAGDWSFQLAWSATRQGTGVLPGWRSGDTRGLVIGATRHF